MKTIIFTKKKILAMAIILSICISSILIPYLNYAESFDGDYQASWTTYAKPGHLTITTDTTDYTKESLIFTGYTSGRAFECALTDPGDSVENEFINFTVDRSRQNPHSCSGAGFLVNVNGDTGAGYFVAMYKDQLFLIRSDNLFKTTSSGKPMLSDGIGVHVSGVSHTCPICGEVYGFNYSYNMGGSTCDTGSPYQLPIYGKNTYYSGYHSVYNGTDDREWEVYYTDESGSHYRLVGGTDNRTLDHQDSYRAAAPTTTGRVASCAIPSTNIINISIQATQNRLKIIANDNEIADWSLAPTGGSLFGPAVQWGNHNCSTISSVTFSRIQVGINKIAPIADFDYNLTSATVRQKIVVSYSARDLNNPPSELTYLWSVTKDEETIATDVSTPINYNMYGPGHYETTLKVKNKYGLFAPVVTKSLDLVATPEISISPQNDTIDSGELAQFKVSNWYNSSILTTDVTIGVDFSDYLFEPSVSLVGASSFDLIDPIEGFDTSDLLVDATFTYNDGTSCELNDIVVPPDGKIITDDSENTETKQIKNITLIYKQLPPLASLKTNAYMTYTTSTSKDLASYYVGGGAPRRYEINTIATCELPSYLDPTTTLSALDKAKITLIEGTGVFTLNGIIDGNGAMVELPTCDTAFYLSGFTVGGGTISQYIHVENGKSNEITIPFGEYKAEESEDYSLGYYSIEPITFKVNESGVIATSNTEVINNKDIQFVKALKVGKVRIFREYEGDEAAFMYTTDDGTYEAVLSGTPIAYKASLNYDLSSLGDDTSYYYDGCSELILPIGSYLVKEKQSNKLFYLKDIYVSDKSEWNCYTNTRGNYKKGSASFSLPNEENIPVALIFTSNGKVYDAYFEEDMMVSFTANVKSNDGGNIRKAEKERVLVEPSDYKYVVRLQNVSTDDDYCVIIDNSQFKSVGFLNPGTYEILCPNNMYFDFDKLKEINSEDIEFYQKGNKNFLTIPLGSVEGQYSEDVTLIDWRGYSSATASLTSFDPEIVNSVSLKILTVDQDGLPVPNASFSIYDTENNLVYFTYKNRKLNPSDKDNPNAISDFKTDENGEFTIFNFPVGEYRIVWLGTDTLFPVYPDKTINITGDSNIAVKMEYCALDKMSLPLLINLSLQKDKIVVDETMQVVYSSYPASSFRGVSFASDDESIVTISEDGVITGIGVGKTKVRVFSSKDGSILCEKDIEVSTPQISALACNPQSLSLDENESFKPEITYSPSNIASPVIDCSSSNPDVVSVSPDGTLTAIAKGTATITYKNGDKITSCYVTVAERIIPVERIELNKDDVFLVYNDPALSTFKLSVIFTPSNVSDMSCIYQSSAPDIISINQDGIITAHASGTAIITVSTPNGCSALCQVSSLPIVKDINLSEDVFSLRVDGENTIFADLYPYNSINKDNITWESSDPDVATIDQQGTVTAHAVGKTMITCKVSYPGTEDTVQICELSVTNDEITASSLNISTYDEENGWIEIDSEKEIELYKNEFITLNTIVSPEEATNAEIEWTYSKNNIVEVYPEDPDNFAPNAKTKIYRLLANGTAGGEVIVTGRVKGTTVSKSFKVYVDSPGTGVHFREDDDLTLVLDIEPTKNVSIAFDNEFSSAKSITWSLSDDSLASLDVTEDQLSADITAIDLGDVDINVEVEFRSGGTYTDTLTVHIEELSVDVLMDGSPVDEIVLKQGEHKVFAINPNCSKDAYERNQDAFKDYSGTGDIAISGAYNTTAPANGHIFEIVGMTPGTYEIDVTYFVNNSFSFPLKITVLPDDTPRVDVIYLGCYQTQISTWDGYSQNPITLRPTVENSGYSISISDESILTAVVSGDTITFHTDNVGEAIMTITPDNPEIAPFEIFFSVYAS